MAIGARCGNIVKLVLSQSLKLALLGIAIGFGLTIGLAHVMTSLIYAIHPRDPAIFLAVAIFVVAISMLAAYVPARRAAGVEPLAALRED
jgi:putative ABC transport system permease protein